MGQKLFMELDTDGSGSIGYDEFISKMANPQVRHYMSAIGVNVTHAGELFKLLDVDDGGTLEIEEFVMGCMQLKGGAKAVDMESLMRQQKRSMAKLRQGVADIQM